jgi:hypothetical protein
VILVLGSAAPQAVNTPALIAKPAMSSSVRILDLVIPPIWRAKGPSALI